MTNPVRNPEEMEISVVAVLLHLYLLARLRTRNKKIETNLSEAILLLKTRIIK